MGEGGGSRHGPSRSGSNTMTLSRSGGDKSTGVRGTKSALLYNTPVKPHKEQQQDDRLAKFTEYRGTNGDNDDEPAPAPSVVPPGVKSHRRSSHSVGDRVEHHHNQLNNNINNNNNTNSLHRGGNRGGDSSDYYERDRERDRDRERGASVPPVMPSTPPGAHIESMRDFYKTSQYRSMYHLPPSPSRPAPVLDRTTSNSNKTIDRSMLLRRERSGDALMTSRQLMGRQPKTSISEGEQTAGDDLPDRVLRPRGRFINNNLNTAGRNTNNNGGDLIRNKLDTGRRVVQQERRGHSAGGGHGGGSGSREREVKRPAPQPPSQRLRRSSADVVQETSMSESESPRQDKNKSDDNWKNTDTTDLAGDVDTDYRRELIGSVHSEARGRDGGGRVGGLSRGEVGGEGAGAPPPPSIYQQAASLTRRQVEISQDDEEEEVVRSPVSLAREEERRKILQLEEDRRAKGQTSRSNSRVTKIIGLKPRTKSADTENESQYSGHSSSSVRKDGSAKQHHHRHSSANSGNRVKRNGSTATNASTATAATTVITNTNGNGRPVNGRSRKMPGSVTSSVNSSESEHGGVGGRGGNSSSRGGTSNASNSGGGSNRSVYLHATAVAEIPSNSSRKSSAESNQSNLKNSKKISRSISLLTPFKSKQAKENAASKEVNYDSAGNQVGGKPPRPPPPGRHRVASTSAAMTSSGQLSKDKKFASSSDLLQRSGGGSAINSSADDEMMVVMSSSASPTTSAEIVRSPIEEQKMMSSSSSSKVSRSVSMPKDTRLAGWFKKRKRV